GVPRELRVADTAGSPTWRKGNAPRDALSPGARSSSQWSSLGSRSRSRRALPYWALHRPAAGGDWSAGDPNRGGVALDDDADAWLDPRAHSGAARNRCPFPLPFDVSIVSPYPRSRQTSKGLPARGHRRGAAGRRRPTSGP